MKTCASAFPFGLIGLWCHTPINYSQESKETANWQTVMYDSLGTFLASQGMIKLDDILKFSSPLFAFAF